MPDISIKSLDGKEFSAYAALPKGSKDDGGHGAGVIVIQEIFGVNAAMRSICDTLADKGFIAVCPDLFWRQQPGIQLTDKTPEEWDRAFELYKNFNIDAGLRDLLATMGHVRRMPGCGGKVGTIGYCLGGKLAYLMATRSDVDCAVSYYGVGLDAMVNEVPDIRMPTMLHIAALDEYTPPEARAKILSATSRNSEIETFVYEGVDHAFARPNGQNYNEQAATLANQRSYDFLSKWLQG